MPDCAFFDRQIEMMNLFMGFEQANRYAISTSLPLVDCVCMVAQIKAIVDIHGNHVG